MKELEKTKRISIAAVLFILVVLIALLTYKRPKYVYDVNTQNTLKTISEQDYFVNLEEIENPDYVLIDVRNQYEFNKGHLANAINMYTPEILDDDNANSLEEFKNNDKTIILYGTNPNEVLVPYMLLNQLGYKNVNILSVENRFSQNKLITKNVDVEHSVADIKAFIEASVKKATVKPKPKPIVKKVLPKKRKKKMPIEGGC